MRLSKHDSAGILAPFIFYCVLSLMLVAVNFTGITNILRVPIGFVTLTPKKILYGFKVNLYTNLNLLSDRDNYQKIVSYENLKRELEVLNTRIQLLHEDNNSLRKQLEAPNPSSWDFLPVKIIGRDRFLLLDKGKSSGLIPGMAVLYQNVFIGRIHEVYRQTARIMMLTDPDFKTAVKTSSGTNGLLVGSFGNDIILSRVLQKDSLNENDKVLTSGEDGNYPADLLIGTVSKTDTNAVDVFKSAQVKPMFDYNALTQVFVLTAF